MFHTAAANDIFILILLFRYVEGASDEHELLDGDLAELNKILAKEDKAMDAEDKEFMWSKRAALQSLPAALPKVLLSAPQFNYTGKLYFIFHS